MNALKETPDWLKANAAGSPIGVDRKAGEAGIIYGYIAAQAGPFKSEGRGEFDMAALKEIVKLMKSAPNGLKSRFAHPTLSDDGLGKLLGRAKNPRMDTISTRESDGALKVDEVAVVRADLHLSPTSRKTPSGDLGGYVLDLAESDPDAMSSSLVLTKEDEHRIDKNGRPARDDNGNVLPPLWRPRRLHASDIVDTGDAVDGILSVDGLPDKLVRQGAAMLDEQFAGQSREVIKARAKSWLGKYLDRRFGLAPQPLKQKTWLEKFGPADDERDPKKIRQLFQERQTEWEQTEGVIGRSIHASDLLPGLPAVRSELKKVPLGIRREWFNRGGRLEAVHCRYTTDHPAWKSMRDESIHGFSIAGLAVASMRFWPEQDRLVVLHEVAHAIDNVFDFPSDETAWQYAAERDRDRGCISADWLADAGSRQFLSEYFADQAARFWHSPETRAELSAPVQRYFEKFEQRFVSKPLDAVA